MKKSIIIAGVIILVVVLGYMVMNGKKSAVTPESAMTENTGTQQTAQVPSDNIYKIKTDSAKGEFVTDFQGMTLYTFDKDSNGVSACEDTCAKNWPPYTSGTTAQSQFPAHISVITRPDGSKQFAWDGKPLYYYVKDAQAGDVTGDGVGGVWHIVKP